jgi:hypothetical protein
MAELEIPDGTLADKNRGSKIILENGDVIEKDTRIYFGALDGMTLEVDSFYEVRSNDIDTWVHLHSPDSSDAGISGIDIVWQELAERVEYGEGKIVSE